MGIIILYLGITLVGYFIGSKLRETPEKFKWTGKVQTVAIFILVFMMGSRIGADKNVLSSLGTIGLSAFILTAFILAGSVGAVFVARRLLKINKEGVVEDD